MDGNTRKWLAVGHLGEVGHLIARRGKMDVGGIHLVSFGVGHV